MPPRQRAACEFAKQYSTAQKSHHYQLRLKAIDLPIQEALATIAVRPDQSLFQPEPQ
jgi:hypothetical protein